MNRVSKCGIDCGTCPWGPHTRKGMTDEEFEQHRNQAKRILGYMPIKTPCYTCQTLDEKIPKQSKLPNRKCLIRQCVDKTGVQNCAYCTRFPCDTLKATAGAWNRESIEKRLGAPISEEEYSVFVAPFEGIKRLTAIRGTLKPNDIIEPVRVETAKKGTAGFPENLPFPEETVASFKAVHKLLTALGHSSMGLAGTDTFAQQHKLNNLRAHVLRFLWIFGSYGTLQKENGALVVDAETYLANRGSEKTLAIWSFVEDTVFKVLAGLGIHCEQTALKDVRREELTTGTGYLRNKGWIMTLSFEEKIGGSVALKALQTYTAKVNKKYCAKAFQRFQEADMQILS